MNSVSVCLSNVYLQVKSCLVIENKDESSVHNYRYCFNKTTT